MNNTRLFVPGIQPSETLSSFIDRASAVYGTSAERLGQALISRWRKSNPSLPVSVKDWDNPPSQVLSLLAEVLGIDYSNDMSPNVVRGGKPSSRLGYPQFESSRNLSDSVIVDGPGWMRPDCRTAWCPRCFYEDLNKGRFPYFRWQWARVATTFCHFHEQPQPLMSWPEISKTGTKGVGRLLDVALQTKKLPVQARITTRCRHAKSKSRYVFISTQLERKKYANMYSVLSIVPESCRRGTLELSEWEDFLDRLVFCDEHGLADHGEQSDTNIPLPSKNEILDLFISLDGQSGQLLPNVNGWHWFHTTQLGIGAMPYSEFGDGDSLWETIRSLENPADRRSLFWLSACMAGPGRTALCEQSPIFLLKVAQDY